MTNDLINLASVPHEIRKLTDATPPTYRALYRKALDGERPVERHNGRLYLTPEHVADIAKTLAA